VNPAVAKTGHSFKGAFAYYLHDKQRDEGGPHLATAERVPWVEVRNLAHHDPAYAQSVMIATARNAEALKREAGVKATGSKTKKGPVYAYALTWHPKNETIPDRAGMLEAVDASLRVLGAEHLQAVIVCHQDTAHPHVHVILNLVDPATGIRHSTWNDFSKLSAWTAAYERERGQIVTPARQTKHPAQTREQQFAKAARGEAAPKTAAAMLFEKQAAQKERHKQEWADLSATNKARRAAIYAERVDFKAIAAAHRAEAKPRWSKLGKVQAAERRAFLEREKRLSGIVRNALAAARSQQKRGVADDRGFLAMAVAYTVSGKARRAVFDAHQQGRKSELGAILDKDLIAKFDAVKAGRAAKLDEVRKGYDLTRAALITRQDIEKGQIRTAWKQIYAERDLVRRPGGRRGDSQAKAPGQTKPATTIAEAIEATAVRPSPAMDAAEQLAEAKQSPDLGKDFLDRAREPAATPAQEAAAQHAQTAGQIRRAWAAVKATQKAAVEQEPGQVKQEGRARSATRERSKGRTRSRVRTRGSSP